MSIKLMAEVWTRQFNHAEQSVMMVMADHADDDGGRVFPSVGLIAWKTDYSGRQVQRVIKQLRQRRVLVLVTAARAQRAHEYKIDLSKAKLKAPFVPLYLRGDKMSGVTFPARGVTNRAETGDIAMSYDPPEEPPIDPPDSPRPKSGGAGKGKGKGKGPKKKAQGDPLVMALSKKFEAVSGIAWVEPKNEKAWKEAETLWLSPLRGMIALANGSAETILAEAVTRLREHKLTVASPKSVIRTFGAIYGERKSAAGAGAVPVVNTDADARAEQARLRAAMRDG